MAKYPFSVNLDYMHPDDLKVIWICHECKKAFLFHSDVDDHRGLTSHELIEKVMMILPTETFTQ
jgi:hypothetical protein